MTQRHPVQNGRTMFVTTNIKNRVPIFADDACAREAIETLYRVQELHPFYIYAFVIMPDHCHFLIYVQEPETISRIINVYKGIVSLNIGCGPIWQSRYFYRLVHTKREVIHYIHQNPVKAGLSLTAQDYRWSSASGLWDVSDVDCP